MAAKLKNLKIRKVDFVDAGANPDAHIRMVKRKDENGQTAEDKGNGNGSILKRLLCFIGKAAGMEQEEIDSAMDEISKGESVSFNEKFNEAKNRKIADEIWDVCYALQSSLCSALNSEGLDNASVMEAMKENLEEFYAVMQESITEWSAGNAACIIKNDGKVSDEDLQIMKSAVDRLNESIDKACRAGEKLNNEKLKGDREEMSIDKSKLTDAEKAFLESIEKRYGMEEGGSPETEVPETEQFPPMPVAKKDTELQTDEPDSIYKGLHPAVAAELEALKKFKQEAEEKELTDIAKKYEIIGKRPEELVPLFKSLREAGGTAYNDMVAVLDQAVDTVEKSGAFSEIGKSGHDGNTDGGAWAEADVKAAELMKSRTGLSKAQALDEVFMADPELAVRCEKED